MCLTYAGSWLPSKSSLVQFFKDKDVCPPAASRFSSPFPVQRPQTHTQRKPACFPSASLNQGLYVSLSKSLSRTLAWQVRVRKRREERERAREGEREKRGCWASWPARSLSLVYQYTASADLLLQAGRKELLYWKAEASRFKEVGAWISGLGSKLSPAGSLWDLWSLMYACLMWKNVDCSTSPKPDFYKQTKKQQTAISRGFTFLEIHSSTFCSLLNAAFELRLLELSN